MVEHDLNDARRDLKTANVVDQGVKLCQRLGLRPAMLFMEQMGVPRTVALRVLCTPSYLRQQDRRRTPRPRRYHLLANAA
ncbi:MAG: hypothetical protein ACREWI_14070 [Telluria sp.]